MMENEIFLKRKKIITLSIVGIIAILAAVLFICFSDIISNSISRLSPGCIFRRLTGLSCPGCGGTRAAIELAHGNYARALSLNFLWLPTAVILLLEYAQAWMNVFFKRSQLQAWNKTRLFLLQAYAAFAVFFFVGRNIWGW